MTSNKSRKSEKKEDARVRKQIVSIFTEERKKNDDNAVDASALIALVQVVTASNIVPTAPEAKSSASSTEANAAALQLNTILKKIRG